MHPHALTRSVGLPPDCEGRYDSVRCDLCHTTRIAATQHCAACQYDECDDCFAKTVAAVVSAAAAVSLGRPVHAHPLTRIEGKPPSYSGVPRCDICRKSDIPVTFNCVREERV